VKLQLVGFDAMLLVEGRELLYAKLLDVDAFLSAAPLGAQPAPGEPRLTLALNAGDVALRDMQVPPFFVQKPGTHLTAHTEQRLPSAQTVLQRGSICVLQSRSPLLGTGCWNFGNS
jgi:hypothetical protein